MARAEYIFETNSVNGGIASSIANAMPMVSGPLRKAVDFLLSYWGPDHCYASWLIEQKVPLWNGARQ